MSDVINSLKNNMSWFDGQFFIAQLIHSLATWKLYQKAGLIRFLQ